MKMASKMSQNHYLKSEKSKVKRLIHRALIVDTPKPRAENRNPKQRKPCAISGKKPWHSGHIGGEHVSGLCICQDIVKV